MTSQLRALLPIFSATLLLTRQAVQAAYMQFELTDSSDNPTKFDDGLMAYVAVDYPKEDEDDDGEEQKEFLLCTSCTISYIIGNKPTGAVVVATEQMNFGGDAGLVTVEFVSTALSMDDTEDKAYSWTMDVGYIADTFVTQRATEEEDEGPDYGINFDMNMLGMAPMTIGNAATDKRQFLYQFIKAAGVTDKTTYEYSYAFNGGDEISFGGTAEDYRDFECDEDDDDCEEPIFPNEGATSTTEVVIPAAGTTVVFAEPLYYYGMDLMLKIQNYVPPMKEELETQLLAINTWNRETLLPAFFYDYFIQTFMIQAYTCDLLAEPEDVYPGLETTYSCFCNNGDYHELPDINLEITDEDFQFDMEAENYLFLPYLNYTVPLSLCVLGIDTANPTTLDGKNAYASLGQRALSDLPFYAVFDFTSGTVEVALGGSEENDGKGALGVQIAISIAIVVVLFVMLVYLIYLRRNRIKAEEWLEQHKNTLFSHAANLKTEEEILEALVKSKELQDMLQDGNRPGGAQAAGKKGNSGDDSKSHSSADSDDDKSNQLLKP